MDNTAEMITGVDSYMVKGLQKIEVRLKEMIEEYETRSMHHQNDRNWNKMRDELLVKQKARRAAARAEAAKAREK